MTTSAAPTEIDLSYVPAYPRPYRCDACGAGSCKLWREYQTTSPRLLCGPCALADQGKAGPIDEGGRRASDYGRTDQIGWYVPAVPCEEGRAYWGYTSVPAAGVSWWRALPSMPVNAEVRP